MSEFTDTARAALLWVLWHHQGGNSPVGQPIRFALGLGQHDHLNESQVLDAKRWAALPAAEREPGAAIRLVSWRCFHCDEFFTDRDAARDHFGRTEFDTPACQFDIKHIRWLEEQHRRNCEDDTEALRTIRGLAGAHETLRRRAEELGYARGLADAQKHPEDLGLRPAADHVKAERCAINLGDIVATQTIAMGAAVVEARLTNHTQGLQWIVNTLAGPGLLPDLDEARALGGAQAWFDKKMAEHDAFRAAHPAPELPKGPTS